MCTEPRRVRGFCTKTAVSADLFFERAASGAAEPECAVLLLVALLLAGACLRGWKGAGRAGPPPHRRIPRSRPFPFGLKGRYPYINILLRQSPELNGA